MLISKSLPLRLEPLSAIDRLPAASIILPFDPKMTSKAEIVDSLRDAVQQVERQVRGRYPMEMCDLMMHKLSTVNRNLNFNTHKKSIAIYVCPFSKKCCTWIFQ